MNGIVCLSNLLVNKGRLGLHGDKFSGETDKIGLNLMLGKMFLEKNRCFLEFLPLVFKFFLGRSKGPVPSVCAAVLMLDQDNGFGMVKTTGDLKLLQQKLPMIFIAQEPHAASSQRNEVVSLGETLIKIGIKFFLEAKINAMEHHCLAGIRRWFLWRHRVKSLPIPRLPCLSPQPLLPQWGALFLFRLLPE